MKKVAERKSRLSFIANASARYRGREREIVVEVFPDYADVRLLGTRTRYPVAWRSIFNLAVERYAVRLREERKAARKGAR